MLWAIFNCIIPQRKGLLVNVVDVPDKEEGQLEPTEVIDR